MKLTRKSPHKTNFSKTPKENKNGRPIPALVFSKDDLSDYISLKNLFDYSLHTLSSSLGYQCNRKEALEHFRRCIDEIGKMQHFSGHKEISAMIKEYLETSRECYKQIERFLHQSPCNDQDTHCLEISLMSKSLNLQWLSICVQDEVKKLIFDSENVA
ncbi:hypothetical protein CHISP_1800 [Chitinispirillum alkaliphilum]|nr:hypothetical protein CHISP_1800 [Chitinispirillum alkaliphilum]